MLLLRSSAILQLNSFSDFVVHVVIVLEGRLGEMGDVRTGKNRLKHKCINSRNYAQRRASDFSQADSMSLGLMRWYNFNIIFSFYLPCSMLYLIIFTC